MKQTIKALMTTTALIFLMTSCAAPEEAVETLATSDVYLSYANEFANFGLFTVADDGTVYIAGVSAENVWTVNEYNLAGEKTAAHTLDASGITSLAAGDGKLFFTAGSMDMATLNMPVLMQYDPQTGETEELLLLEGLNEVRKLTYYDGELFILGIHQDYTSAAHRYTGEDGYTYDGTVILSYELSGGGLKVAFDDLPISFSDPLADGITIYAYDRTGGYYFAKLSGGDHTLGAKTYHAHQLESFAETEKGVVFYTFNNGLSSVATLYYAPLSNPSGVSDVMPGVFIFGKNKITYKKGFTFYYSSNSGTVERIKNSSYIKENKAVKLISSSKYDSNLFSAGYAVSTELLAGDKFALTVLSLDRSYDICYMSTRQDFSANIRDKGSFYPLNDVPGVQEFMDSCFPYIKDAATDQNGDIWMLPIDISIPLLIYDDENCKAAGIDLGAAASIEDVLGAVKTAMEFDPGARLFEYNHSTMMQISTRKYLRGNISLDTPEFRKLAELLKSFSPDYVGNSLAFSEAPEDVLFKTDDTSTTQTRDYMLQNEALKAIPIVPDGEPSSAVCIYLCVNPSSDNLETALEYISAVCEYMLGLQNTYMFTDKTKYTASDYTNSLYEAYQYAQVDFNISSEILARDFDRYLGGEITLDELISEADRKLSMYLNE